MPTTGQFIYGKSFKYHEQIDGSSPRGKPQHTSLFIRYRSAFRRRDHHGLLHRRQLSDCTARLAPLTAVVLYFAWFSRLLPNFLLIIFLQEMSHKIALFVATDMSCPPPRKASLEGR